MATTANSTTKSRSAAAKKAAETRAQNQQSVTETAVAYIRETAERAVDVPVGAALTVAGGVAAGAHLLIKLNTGVTVLPKLSSRSLMLSRISPFRFH